MAISVVRRNVGSDFATTGSATAAFASNTASNAIIAIGIIDGPVASLSTPTDTKGNTYTLVQTIDNSWTMKIKVWVNYNILVSAGTNTVTMSDGFQSVGLFVFEVTGLASSAAYDKTASQQQASATSLSSTATATTTNANELLIGITGNSHSSALLPTVGAGFSNLQTFGGAFANGGSEEQIVAATGAQTATFGIAANTDNHTTAIFTFSDTGIGGAGTPTGWQHPVNQPYSYYTKPIIEMY